MFTNKILILLLVLICKAAIAQEVSTSDSLQVLDNIVVNAFENNRKLILVPAAISIVRKSDLDRFNNVSILPALNNNPGVKMEERSPGSYRLSIRGSSLRAPFGIRNVKVYYDGIPFTDPGGNTYLNLLGFYNIQSLEILKGPSGSLYGAGTGGVLLIRNQGDDFRPGLSAGITLGSYDMMNVNATAGFGNQQANNSISFQHLSSNGYRDHTQLRRDVVTWDSKIKASEKSELKAHFLFSDLYYQTPGALTKKQFDENPRASRPAGGPYPGADQAKAAFYQKSFFVGLTYEQKINEQFKNTTSVYGDYTFTRNPAIRNYERRTEPHFGGRTVFELKKNLNNTQFTFHAGAEFQQSFNAQSVYGNKNGATDTLQSSDEIFINQGFIFLQAIATFPGGWVATAGASFNKSTIDFRRLSVTPAIDHKRNFNNELSPRIALLKELKKHLSVYGSIARGFSTPAISEILPSINVFNTTLQAEDGINYEIGSRGSLLKNRIYFDVNAFYYKLKNAIVQRQNPSGADYFINAGSANQYGLETLLTWLLFSGDQQFIKTAKLSVSDTWNNFRYDQFEQNDKNYSGNKIPGVASQTLTAGVDLNTKAGLYLNTNFLYSGPVALNDGNTDFASSYSLLGTRVGYRTPSGKKIQWEIFCGADNILDEKYSLGNDINAAVGRYYNVAPGLNYFAGIRFGL